MRKAPTGRDHREAEGPVREARADGVAIVTIPGPSAVIAAPTKTAISRSLTTAPSAQALLLAYEWAAQVSDDRAATFSGWSSPWNSSSARRK